ncbi:uncharacterized protein SPPG_00993 [Spizellomyces punctatus DAOM BR117]|uniref:Calponin-homology (CH) domain-containing protein n=1 Tax=Spizellomyces punctatus (strain DAOM BR117) TaxID=645134 RepID=A0A0L0HQZ9_SPIPD|nr:uncharacterized protein SPPG_00993 [Spizellomyces punctatus DAOM BR117]KND03512.1 hypothetical protein SPPG_00993 [Spizellomyces punctatus DAOM BR117]|eukprot:XP_016611551.1 hypothetical protein SPPG_00993 [Spizellomyces punctatus DAOM BR117]
MMSQLVPGEIDEDDLYAWIDEIPLSRPKRNIQRDFSDAVAAAEVVRHFLPKLVDLHNYPPANGMAQKLYNWKTLNQKVFRKIGYHVSEELIQNVASNRPGCIEYLLHGLRQKIDAYLARQVRQHNSAIRSTSALDRSSYNDMTKIRSGSHSHGWQASVSREDYVSPPKSQAPLDSVPPVTHVGMATASMPMMSEEHPSNMFLEHKSNLYDGHKHDMVAELQETVEMLQLKICKLEQLVDLKDRRIEELTLRLRSHGLA